MTEQVNAVIIGGGAVGCAIAYELSKTLDDIVLVEKNRKIKADNQSSRNSGVIHAGIYYDKRTSPLKARLCVEGNAMMYEFCREQRIPHKQTGKLLVATDNLDEEYLDDVLKTANENSVPGVKKISIEEAKSMEPNINGIAALYVPTSGIIEPTSLVWKLYARSNGKTSYLTGNQVVRIKPTSSGFEVTVMHDIFMETIKTRLLINSAGLHSDEIAKMINPENNYEIDPVRGESAKFCSNKRPEISFNYMNVYPAPYGYYNDTGEKAKVPLSEFNALLKKGIVTKTVGIHLTPTIDEFGICDEVTIGPSKTVGLGKEDYASNLRPPQYYYDRVKSFFPGLKLEDITLHQAGIMAVLKGHTDWVIERDRKYPNCIQLVGIDSPGLTASLAIAKYVRELIGK